MKKKRIHTLRRILSYLLEYKVLMIIAVLLSIGGNLFALMGPMLSGYAIDSIEFGSGSVNFDKVYYYCGIMIIFYIISSILAYILSVIMLEVSKRISYKLRKDLFDHLLSLPVGYFDTHATGDIISKISYDVDTLNSSLTSDLVTICGSIITVIVSFISMVMISTKLVLIFVFTVPLSIIITKRITKITRPMFRNRSRKLGELNGMVEEFISGQKTLRAYNQEENTKDKFGRKNEEAVNAYYRADYYGAMVGPSVNFMNNLSLTLISIFGAIMYLYGKMSLGNISSFVLYSRKFSGPINESANIIGEFQSSLAAAERIFQLMDELAEEKDKENAKELSYVQGDVTVENVSFGYTADKLILKNLSMKAPSGNMIAIVGPTGAGKTTLINLLMRFYDVNYGNIYVDDMEIRDITRKSLRKSYAMVLQDTWLFQGTIFENIAYGSESATLEDVINAAKAAKIHSYIKRLPEGYDTILTDDGANISKGQKQLLTIARAMLLDSKMLILDEATSNVDTRTEIQIQQAMRNLMKGKTCFVIAHRLSTIKSADHILVVKDGNIIEQGNHKELIKEKGFYSQLYYSQFE
ncbi:MAG: ABC transporter ATP-binding protein [Clostridium argentinense]|uniref:ABC transporter ATP-binding protein n=1 Tax=Clostridium faecium TaxID=2762223 RepID=A0ABR8YSY0_9CLOT|nr:MULTISPECIES: ABC transporter ATP-binding protein [Clostridium]MBD8047372.1 ABC transporter ATP-binding protein [Clostridium faecium]MBS5823550.1 ABC transporter ATP-binding protein [Clostridium argentinense]MDU1350456.1 ABC transporter ATP-binding protein [Clostridium argentinense]